MNQQTSLQQSGFTPHLGVKASTSYWRYWVPDLTGSQVVIQFDVRLIRKAPTSQSLNNHGLSCPHTTYFFRVDQPDEKPSDSSNEYRGIIHRRLGVFELVESISCSCHG